MFRICPAPAKLNLVLELTGRRRDGYHLLAAVSQTVGWHDLLGIELCDSGDSPRCSLWVAGPHAHEVPKDQENIVIRAVELLRRAGRGYPISRIVLDKRIPTQSGLGGGSADAAAVLRVASRDCPDPDLAAMALQCGADVPFALLGGAAQSSGVGEQLTPLPSLTQGVFLITMLGEVSTRAAYSAVAAEDFSKGERAEAVAQALRQGKLPDPKLLGSSLLPAALRVTPGLAERLGRLRAATPELHWAMTGSGGAFFSLVADRDQAQRAVARLSTLYPTLPLRATTPEPEWQATV